MADEIRLGKYIIKKELGRGGFGIVYEALDSVLKRSVALKVLHPPLTVDTHFLERFRKEAEVAAQMDHPNIVSLFDFNQIDGRYFITMGLMKRGSLKDHLSQYGAMGVHQAKTMLEQMASGLAYAHELGIIHRDLKPGNILIDDKGIARLSDFGFAKVRSADSLSMTVGGGLFGTPSYMAPEIWEGKSAMVQSDIYSLGCIAHEMLTGKQLFQGETPIQVLHAHVKRESLRIEGISPDWQTFLDKCLESKPENRYQSVNAILEDLKFGLFDAAEERQSEIVLNSQDDTFAEDDSGAIEEELNMPESGVSYSPAQGAGSVESSYGRYGDYDYGAPEKEALRAGEEAQRTSTVRYSQTAPETPTPGQMLELSPFKRLQIRLPWLLPLSLGVVITLLAVVFVNMLRKNNEGMYNAKEMETPTRTERLEQSHTELPTNTPIPTNTPEPEVPIEPVEEPEPEPIEEPIEPLGAGSTMLREKDGMEMVYVPEGTFTMGSNNVDNEKPAREVYLDAYWIDKYEVSNAQYALCVEAGECTKPRSSSSYTRYNYYGNPTYDNYPVINVDWEQASAYCAWAGGRLPSEAEWEKAARGPNGNKYPWGNESLSCDLANYNQGTYENSKYCVGDTSEVGSYPEGASYYGAMDMAGNVWEWVNDWYANTYDAHQLNNPPGPSSGTSRVLRGGSWDNYSWNVRSAIRFRGNPYNRTAGSASGGSVVLSRGNRSQKYENS